MDYYNQNPNSPTPSSSFYPLAPSVPPPQIPVNPPYRFDPRLTPKLPLKPFEPTVIDNKSDDELWIETWLAKLGKITINLDCTIKINTPEKTNKHALKKPQKPPLHVAKKILVRCTKVIESLECAEKYMRENVQSMISEEWKEKTVEIGCLKDELTALFTQFENPNVVASLQSLVSKRQKKRLAQKRRKLKNKAALQADRMETAIAHKEIDEWLQSMQESIEKAKNVSKFAFYK